MDLNLTPRFNTVGELETNKYPLDFNSKNQNRTISPISPLERKYSPAPFNKGKLLSKPYPISLITIQSNLEKSSSATSLKMQSPFKPRKIKNNEIYFNRNSLKYKFNTINRVPNFEILNISYSKQNLAKPSKIKLTPLSRSISPQPFN